MTSIRKGLQKSTNRNTTLDKGSTVQLIKAVFEERFEEHQLEI